MKKFIRILVVFIFVSPFFLSGCCCRNNGDILESDSKFSNMKNGILMVTKKRIMKNPKSMSELRQFVENESHSEKGYGSVYIEEFSGISNSGTLKGSGKDIAFYYDFLFRADESGLWNFEFGIDAGIASGCLVDDKELWFESQDIWTLGDYSQAFKKGVKLNRGWHRIRIYGLEGCCDGVWRLRYKSPSMKDFNIVSVKNLGVKCPPKI